MKEIYSVITDKDVIFSSTDLEETGINSVDEVLFPKVKAFELIEKGVGNNVIKKVPEYARVKFKKLKFRRSIKGKDYE